MCSMVSQAGLMLLKCLSRQEMNRSRRSPHCHDALATVLSIAYVGAWHLEHLHLVDAAGICLPEVHAPLKQAQNCFGAHSQPSPQPRCHEPAACLRRRRAQAAAARSLGRVTRAAHPPGGNPDQNPSSERPRAGPERRRRPPGLMDDAGDESQGEGASAEACGDDVHAPGAVMDPGPDADADPGVAMRAGTSGRAGGGAAAAGSGPGQWDARGHMRFGQGGAGLRGAGQGAGGFEPGRRAGGGLAGLAGRQDEPGEDSEGGDLRAPPVASEYLAASHAGRR